MNKPLIFTNMSTNFTNTIRDIRAYIRAHSRGFTTVELLVAMSIFAIFITVAFGVFVQAVNGQRDLTRYLSVQNNAALVIEQMMREVRTGHWFCGGTENGITPCETSGSSLTFVNHAGDTVTYSLNGGAVKRGGTALTSSAVRVSGLQFFITQENDRCVPPRITMVMQVGLAGGGGSVPIQNLETTVSSRVFPVEVKGAPDSIVTSCPRV